MIRDPSMDWNGVFPYDALAAAGVTPDTSHAEMQDVSFELLARGLMTPRTQQAWDELRTVRHRLLADLLLYDVDLPAEIAAAGARTDAALRALPDSDSTADAAPDASPDTATDTAPDATPDTSPDASAVSAQERAALLDALIRFDI